MNTEFVKLEINNFLYTHSEEVERMFSAYSCESGAELSQQEVTEMLKNLLFHFAEHILKDE